jgi:drug/metabolite transporter (DMT)-like permease
MFSKVSPRITAVCTALFVTVLWSSSWILVKLGLNDIPPLTFAGLRYAWAFIVLLPVTLLNQSHRSVIRTLTHRQWFRLTLLGLLYYTLTQGLVYVALEYLRAATLSLMLNFTSALVAILSIFWLAEVPTRLQWIGVSIFLLGALIYFYPLGFDEPFIGLVVGALVVLTNALSSLLGRDINRTPSSDPMIVTFVSMGAGSIILLGAGILLQGLPSIDWKSWAIIGWLAIINSAFAFTLWNMTQRTLTATESSIINNTMLIQIAVLAWAFLDERLTAQEIGGLLIATIGILLVQVRGSVITLKILGKGKSHSDGTP